MTSKCSLLTAKQMAVLALAVSNLGEAPLSMSCLTTSRWPFLLL